MPESPEQIQKKAADLRKSAHNGFLAKFTGPNTEKLETAADEYARAAVAYKTEKMFFEAGKMYEEAAVIHLNDLKEPNDAANAYVSAFKAYSNGFPKDAVRCVDYAIERYQSTDNVRRAATHKENAAKLLKAEGMNKQRPRPERDVLLEQAMASFAQAAQWYDEDKAVVTANRQWEEVAEVAATLREYQKAIEACIRLARRLKSQNNMMASYNIPKLYFRAAICRIIMGDERRLIKWLDESLKKEPFKFDGPLFFSRQDEEEFEGAKGEEREISLEQEIFTYAQHGAFQDKVDFLLKEIPDTINFIRDQAKENEGKRIDMAGNPDVLPSRQQRMDPYYYDDESEDMIEEPAEVDMSPWEKIRNSTKLTSRDPLVDEQIRRMGIQVRLAAVDDVIAERQGARGANDYS